MARVRRRSVVRWGTPRTSEDRRRRQQLLRLWVVQRRWVERRRRRRRLCRRRHWRWKRTGKRPCVPRDCGRWRAKTGGGVFNSFGNILQPATIVTAFQRTARRRLSMTSRLAIPERSPTPAAVEGLTSSGQLFWHPSELFSRPNYVAHFLQRRLSITLRFPRFPVPRFPPLWFGAGFSSSAFSSLAFSAPS